MWERTEFLESEGNARMVTVVRRGIRFSIVFLQVLTRGPTIPRTPDHLLGGPVTWGRGMDVEYVVPQITSERAK